MVSDDSPAARPDEGAAPLDHKLVVTLHQSSWDAITTLLGGYPYCQVATLIDEIKVQTGSQLVDIMLIECLWRAPIGGVAKH